MEAVARRSLASGWRNAPGMALGGEDFMSDDTDFALDPIGRLAHHLESDVTAHREPAQRKSVGCRCEDCPGDRTHGVVSRVICDTYSDLSPQRRDLFCEKILGAGQPRH